MIAGVVAVNVAFVAAGFALLGRPRWHVSWAGLALLVGAGAVGTLLFFATIVGLRLSWPLVAVVVLGLVAVGLSRARGSERPARGAVEVPRLAAAVLAVVAAICALGVVGGFRSSPWLDDAWGIWLPKGLALWEHGLDERLFVLNGDYVTFGVPDYPLWWSIVSSLNVQAAGSIDVRVMCAQLGLLTAAFVAAVARLLWGYVRPLLLAPALLLLVLSPELWRQVQGGVADLPLAFYVALFVLALIGWVARREPFWLFLAALSGVTAAQLKTEALPELLLAAAVVAVAARARPAVLGVAGAAAATVLAAVPWLVWRAVHDVPARASLEQAFDPGFLADRAERVAPTVEELAAQSLNPGRWLPALVLLLAVAVLGWARERRREWLLPIAGVLLGFVFLVWVYWSNPDEIDFLLATSAYRTIDPLVVTAAVILPLAAERLVRAR